MRSSATIVLGCGLLLGGHATLACPLFASGFEAGELPPAADDLCPLSDEFDDSATLADWSRLYEVEGWPDQLENWDIAIGQAGHMTLLPYTSSWYEDLRGVLVFKPVTGDFVVSTRFTAGNRAQTGAPQALFSLAGLFIRAPRDIQSPDDWTPGGENYVFLSAGSADSPGNYQYEVKTTIDSESTLHITSACETTCDPLRTFELRAARLEGDHMIMLRREPGSTWQVHRRYPRNDLPENLQVGVTSYTDWGSIIGVYWPDDQFGHNNTVITDGNPDLLARFEYVRFRRPAIPAGLQGRNFSAPFDPGDPTTVSDAELLSFLGF
ncbi:MAG TPA: hypothetical protein PKZ76_09210 [Xanthomonadaceae bacterium]|nr:hypothetical protein [Xanthomonadaceae bacterium]